MPSSTLNPRTESWLNLGPYKSPTSGADSNGSLPASDRLAPDAAAPAVAASWLRKPEPLVVVPLSEFLHAASKQMDKAVAEIRRMAAADVFDGILWKLRAQGLQSVTVVKFAGACGPDAIRTCLASICAILHPSIEPDMPHSPAEKKKAINRVRRIRGQAEALEQR